jgi:hypothetical protein
VVALLTVPALGHASRIKHLGRGYIQLGDDGDNYQDRDGIATEDSIRAFTDTRPRVAIWLGTVVGLGSSIAARGLAWKHTDHTNVFPELVAWAEPACWVRHALSATLMSTGLIVHRSSCACNVQFSPPRTDT